MRRLTLILSDLYLPDEAARDIATHSSVALPALDALLRFANVTRVDDWRSWLCAQLPDQLTDTSLPAICAHGVVPNRDLDTAWFATPLHAEARLDHVRLDDRGVLRLDAGERTAACEEFARVFGSGHGLYDGGDRTFFFTGLPDPGVRTVDPARLLGSDIQGALPERAATELRRLSSEIEMWLHGSELNAARERARKPRVSMLWLWRGAAHPHVVGKPAGIDPSFFGSDPLIGALARRHGRARDVPFEFRDLDGSQEHVIAEFAPVTGAPHERLPALDSKWFAPIAQALASGELDSLEIVANDRRLAVDRKSRLKFWRRTRPWLELLGAPTAKA